MIRRRILIDTDIGDDIDDAFAIALAASLPELELVGVTTVFRNTAQRAQLAHRLLSSLGREDIPVRAGERLPEREPIHVFERDPAGAPEDADLCQWEPAYAQLPAEDGAVDFLIRMAEEYGESLTLVPIGAMTNLARAIERNPEAMKRVGAIVTMGGMFSAEDPEWNILCDPEAAHTVSSWGRPPFAGGLPDPLPGARAPGVLEQFRASARPVNRLLTQWLDRWFAYMRFEKSVMHDPLTVATLVSDVCRFETRYVRVRLNEKRGAIETRCQPAEGFAPIKAAVQVDRERFYALIRSQLLD